MKQKTKAILAGLAMGVTPVVGLACVGVAIWGITEMPHPYINQWVDLYRGYFPIVSQVNNKTVADWYKKETITTDDVFNFYFEKITKSAEIFCEDFLSAETENMGTYRDGNWVKNLVRISDVRIFKNDDENFHRINFLWNQNLIYQYGESNKIQFDKLKWEAKYNGLILDISKPIAGWDLTFKKDNRTNATITISECQNRYVEQDVGTYHITEGIVDAGLNEYFYKFDFQSFYLQEVII